jgi:hypothetical protein
VEDPVVGGEPPMNGKGRVTGSQMTLAYCIAQISHKHSKLN